MVPWQIDMLTFVEECQPWWCHRPQWRIYIAYFWPSSMTTLYRCKHGIPILQNCPCIMSNTASDTDMCLILSNTYWMHEARLYLADTGGIRTGRVSELLFFHLFFLLLIKIRCVTVTCFDHFSNENVSLLSILVMFIYCAFIYLILNLNLIFYWSILTISYLKFLNFPRISIFVLYPCRII
jgi:hypothetical protein